VLTKLLENVEVYIKHAFFLIRALQNIALLDRLFTARVLCYRDLFAMSRDFQLRI